MSTSHSEARVVLEPFESADIDRLIAWIDSPEALMQWGGPVFTFPLDRPQLEAHIRRARRAPPSSLLYRVIDLDTQNVVGHAELGSIDRFNGGARASRLLVGPTEQRGRGFGGALVEALLEIAFEVLALHRVELGVYDFNAAAIRCYEYAGFQHEGVRREAAKVGNTYWNSCTMSILDHEWRERSR